MWRLSGQGWEKYYVAGVNLGPGAPGYTPGEPPLDGQMYAGWLRDVERMNANVLRAYTLLPTSFYRAFRHSVEAGSHLQLYQQIWISVPPDNNLYDQKFVEQSKSEIRYIVDALHGRADVPRKRARGSGIYVNDVSGQVAALLFGREIEPSIA